MRDPDQLTPDELATMNLLWALWPDEVLMLPERDHRKLDDLVSDGYVERTEYEQGIGYRLAPEHAAGLARVAAANAEQAEMN